MAFGFGLPGSGNTMNLAGTPLPAPVMGPGLGFGGQPADGGGITLAHLLAAIAGGAAAGVSNDRGAIGGAGRGFLAGQQQSQAQIDRQLALEDRAQRKQYLGMQMTSMEEEALQRKADREAAARHTADLNTFVSSLPPEQQAAARINPAGFAKGPPDRPFGWNADGTPVVGGPNDPAYKAGVAGATKAAEAPYTLNKLGPGEQAWWGMTPGGQGGGSVTPEAFGSALIGPESNGQQFDANGQPLVSSAGAIGKMQVMPNTARQVAASLGIPYDEHMLRTNPAYNEKLGRAYATQLLSKYGDPGLAAAAYNAGPGAVDAWLAAGKPTSGPQALPAETASYVPRVLAGLKGGGTPAGGGITNQGGVLTNTNVAGGTWAPATQDGIPGQRNTLSGKFEPTAGAEGKSLDERDGKILRDGDPNGVEYAQAYYRQYMTPKFVQGTDGQGNATFVPIMPAVPPNIRKPNFAATGPGGAPVDTGPAGPAGGPSGARAAAPATGSLAGGQAGPSVGTPIVTGVAKGQTEDARKSMQLYSVTKPQLDIALKNFDALGDLGNRIGDSVPMVGNYLTSESFQRGYNAVTTIIANYLYSVSGATANPGEVANQTRVLMPQPGEKPGSVADKRARIANMVESIHIRAANGIAPGQPLPQGIADPAAGDAAGASTAPATAAKPGAAPATPKSQAEFDALQSGALYHDPADAPGIMRQKP